MLVISRKPGEKLRIGDSVSLTILSVSGDKIALGVDAPRDISILRGELVETIESNRESTAALIQGETIRGLAALIKEKGGGTSAAAEAAKQPGVEK
ncbi:MAG: carbon storage regulator [Clostridiales Family XIII bacterium]|jgi:carbon storage regulator|nr:carbon storage regulator [Clostridiales Family XIII bacterium]